MAWGEPTSLKFDISEISKMRSKIQETSTELSNLKTQLLNEVETLKSKWQTPAGKKFTEEVDTDWAKQVDKYIVIINAVDELLEVAENSYKEVEIAAKKVSF